jgi:autotransporter-associated beta strand protein
MNVNMKWVSRCIVVAACTVGMSIGAGQAVAQRTLGLDVSYWQGAIDQSDWNTAYSTGDREFVFVRSSRGGTTGLDQAQGTPGGGSTATGSLRYDDSRFLQNITRATSAGLMTSAYHFARPDNAGNTGTDEADHMMQMAGLFMRPGYLPPMFDLEAGQSQTTPEQLAQFTLDFSNRIYAVMQIRPSIYINGNYSNDLAGASASLRNQIAQPATNSPSVVSPGYPTLVSARWPAGSGNPYTGDIQNGNPKDAGGTLSTFYGPWDDYGTTHPWNFWQYSSGEAIPGFADTTTDADIAAGDLEYVKDRLVPALWWNDSSGDWSTLANWNSGQPVVTPTPGAGQAPFYTYDSAQLPVARLPGAAGSGPTAGSNDTVILERPNANITVTLSTGSHNIRKMYMRETLNITGGTLTINYDPNYSNDFDNNPSTTYPNALRSGTISAQFSGAVTLSGTGSLSVNTLQVDASKTFTLAGSTGTLTFKTINLLSSAKIAVTGDVNINPLSNATATISGSSGNVDLSAGTRIFTVGNGSSDVDLDVASPIINGGLTKSGAGTMRLSGSNTFTGNVTVNAGVLRSNNAAGFTNSTVVTVNAGGTWDMNGIADAVASLSGNGGAVTQGSAGLTLVAASGSTTFAGAITGSGTFTKNGAATQILSGNNSLGPVALNAGTLLFKGTNTTGAVTVANGATLGGTGSVSGAVTVNTGGHVAPGASIESLNVGQLTFNSGSALDIELAAPGNNDSINVAGVLTLTGGTVNLVDLGGVDAGTYTLINYGILSGNVANLGAPIGGPAGFNYELADSGSSIDLLVLLPGDFNKDGSVDAGDYSLWRKVGGTPDELDLWRANFGRTAGTGSGGGLNGTASVPEPASVVLVVGGLLAFVGRRFRRRI